MDADQQGGDIAGSSAAGDEADTFRHILFDRVPAEDLAPYDEAALRRLAAQAHEHLAKRMPGRADIRIEPLDLFAEGARRELTILEAINDNAPYLLDSALAELSARGLEPLLVAHPIVAVERDRDGTLTELLGEVTSGHDPGPNRESILHIHLDRLDGDTGELRAALERVFEDVAQVAEDIEAMRGQLSGLAEEYRRSPPPMEPAEIEEALAFLAWLGEEHFTLLGMRAYRMPDSDAASEPVDGSGLGLLRDETQQVLRRGRELVAVTPEIRAFFQLPKLLMVTKASVRSRVYRRSYLDYVGAKLFSPSGRLWGELAIVGMFTQAAATSPAVSVPYLRRKVARMVARAGFDPASHAGRALVEVLESYPRDELFQIDDDTLFGFALDLMGLYEHPRVRALARIDRFDRFVSVIVFVPKERYDTTVRRQIGAFLARVYGGRLSAAYPAYPEGPLARTHFIIGRDEGGAPDVPRAELERGITAITRTWADKLGDALRDGTGGARARDLAGRYATGFSAAYREAFDASVAIADIGRVEQLSEKRPRAAVLYRREGDPDTRVNLKLFALGSALPLSERVPLLEALGFRVVDERTYRIAPHGEAAGGTRPQRVWLHDMALEPASGKAVALESAGPRLEAALLAIFRGLAESDNFNKLVLEAGLGWRDAALFRAYARYLRQIGGRYGQNYMADVLAQHPDSVAALVALFYARFDPGIAAADRETREAESRARIDELLAAVTSLDDDTILRRTMNLIGSTLRTNYFQLGSGGLPSEMIAFKLACHAVDEMPAPRPLYEIFMNSPRVEGLHLRFGKVARGGLRWTDRPQDFRTEILGLVKAQQVKNAVIVPVGAKGGFFPKLLPPASDRAAWMAEGTEAYRIFIRTLLSLTDNIKGTGIVPPPDTVRHDPDDPYLVVAADKGTATFSDVANAISIERGHWLGDAFASGGSQGYDHKAMGITARGAWEAVKRHFREIDVDIQTAPVTVVGVGDMSGDVFGNGMLLSTSMKLLAAFDHRDIFLDPNPDVPRAFAERQRLFALPRSSWQDYDKALISDGGGVFPRAAKTIRLSPEIRAVLGVEPTEMAPAALISAILKAPVGLLWFGGIGTYIRASDETDAQAGDRANDAVRVTGADIRAQVIGEGANLGTTQRGRIEAASRGVRLNTDAIDNSAGVNTSDVEVNIKIALAEPVRDGRLSEPDRNTLLAAMTEEVGGLVLRNNYLQTLSLSLSERRGPGDLDFLARLMEVLERAGRLDRAIEYLPDAAALAERARAGRGLTRPELAVLLAYAKLSLHDALLDSSVPDDPYLGRELDRYFPAALRERFPDAIAGHRLRREIIATQLANAIVNRGGPAVVTRLADDAGADAPTIAAAYAATRDVFDLVALHAGLDALDGRIGGAAQLALYASVQDVSLTRIVWFIRNVDFHERTLDDVVGQYRDGIASIRDAIGTLLPPRAAEALAAARAKLEAEGVPGDLATRLATLPELAAAPDIVLVAQRSGRPLHDVARAHFALADTLRLSDLTGAADTIPVGDRYDRLARDRAIDTVATAHRRLTAEVVGRGDGIDDPIAAWSAARGAEAERIKAAVDGIVGSGLTVSKLTVAANLLGDLAKA